MLVIRARNLIQKPYISLPLCSYSFYIYFFGFFFLFFSFRFLFFVSIEAMADSSQCHINIIFIVVGVKEHASYTQSLQLPAIRLTSASNLTYICTCICIYKVIYCVQSVTYIFIIYTVKNFV